MFINARRIHIKPFDNTCLLCSLANLSLAIFYAVSISVVETLFSLSLIRHPRMIFQRPTINFSPSINLKHSLFQF